MVTVLQGVLNIEPYDYLNINYFLETKLRHTLRRCKGIVEKLAAYYNKSAIMSVKLHMLHTTECYTATLKICYTDS